MFSFNKRSRIARLSCVLIVCAATACLSSCAAMHTPEPDRIYPDLRFAYRSEDIGTIRLTNQAEVAANTYCGADIPDSSTNQIREKRDCVRAVRGRILDTIRNRARSGSGPG